MIGEKKEEAKKLTDGEANKLKEPLVDAILWQSEHIDEIIIATTKGHDKSLEIWGDLDREEAEILADVLLTNGKRSARAAQMIRNMITLQEKIKVATIIAPRFYKMFQIYMVKGFSIR